MRLAAPRDAATLREELREAVAVADAPTVVRFPKGAPPVDIPALERRAAGRRAAPRATSDVLLVAVGSMVPMCLDVADRLRPTRASGSPSSTRAGCCPVAAELGRPRGRAPAGRHRRGQRPGRREWARDHPGAAGRAACDVPVRDFGMPQAFLDHGSRGQVLADARAHRAGHLARGRRGDGGSPPGPSPRRPDRPTGPDRRDPGRAVAVGPPRICSGRGAIAVSGVGLRSECGAGRPPLAGDDDLVAGDAARRARSHARRDRARRGGRDGEGRVGAAGSSQPRFRIGTAAGRDRRADADQRGRTADGRAGSPRRSRPWA